MPPRKRVETKPATPKAATPDVPHVEGCSDPTRVESYTVTRPDGSEARVTRCIECGGQLIE